MDFHGDKEINIVPSKKVHKKGKFSPVHTYFIQGSKTQFDFSVYLIILDNVMLCDPTQ